MGMHPLVGIPSRRSYKLGFFFHSHKLVVDVVTDDFGPVELCFTIDDLLD